MAGRAVNRSGSSPRPTGHLVVLLGQAAGNPLHCRASVGSGFNRKSGGLPSVVQPPAGGVRRGRVAQRGFALLLNTVEPVGFPSRPVHQLAGIPGGTGLGIAGRPVPSAAVLGKKPLQRPGVFTFIARTRPELRSRARCPAGIPPQRSPGDGFLGIKRHVLHAQRRNRGQAVDLGRMERRVDPCGQGWREPDLRTSAVGKLGQGDTGGGDNAGLSVDAHELGAAV